MFFSVLQKVVCCVFFLSYDLFIEPVPVPAAEYNEAVGFGVHEATRLIDELLQFGFGDFAFEDRVLYPMQITAAQLEHLGRALLGYIIYGNDIHFTTRL
ncbi:MAG: hypothetical protein KatS3mg087_2152 [Patescibacteria group bacterium]|nr:MAG: hypothetical protein KatS3mg087_2152 [Patescibacteria group bacterium]